MYSEGHREEVQQGEAEAVAEVVHSTVVAKQLQEERATNFVVQNDTMDKAKLVFFPHTQSPHLHLLGGETCALSGCSAVKARRVCVCVRSKSYAFSL